MTVKTGSTWAGLFVTLDATGALAAGTPAGVLYVDGVADGASVTITGSNPYKWSVTLPALTAGQRVDMYITATISTIATASVVASEQADTALLSEVKTDTAAILADTGTDGVKIHTTQGAITWGQQKIVANVAGEGALDIENTNATGIGTMNEAPYAGMFNKATGASGSGLLNNSTNASGVGQRNYADGSMSYGIVNVGTFKNVSGFDSAQALEATLTAIKGAGWNDETLVALMTAIEGISAGSGASVADILNALLASYTVSGSVGESLGRLDNIQAKTDLITTGTTITIASPVSGSTITAQRGDTLSAALENIGALTNHSKLYFTVKWDAADADTAALIQIEHTAGLLYINGAAAVTAANGTLTVDDEATGDITIGLAAVEAAKLPLGSYSYDVQIVRSAGTVSTLTSGNFTVSADVTRAVT
jgi:hypothetical protein